MLRTQTDPSLCALAQVAPRSQTALVSGLGNAATQATGRPPDDLCRWKGTRHLPDHARSRCRLIKPTPFGSGLFLQNVQTPDTPLQRGVSDGPGVGTASAVYPPP